MAAQEMGGGVVDREWWDLGRDKSGITDEGEGEG